MTNQSNNVVWLESCNLTDSGLVGGKNASLGEMIWSPSLEEVNVPPGFAVTTKAYKRFIEINDLGPLIEEIDTRLRKRAISISKAGIQIRRAILSGNWQEEVVLEIGRYYRELSERCNQTEADVAVRSSATAEDQKDASFAGQFESFLNVRGNDALLDACRRCYASLFSDRAISYRIAKGFDHVNAAMAVGIQQMVRADKGCSGVIISNDPETGFNKFAVVSATWGLGENVGQATTEPDEFVVFKPFLDDAKLDPIIGKLLGRKAQKLIYGREEYATRNVPASKSERSTYALPDVEVLALSRLACKLEHHFGRPIDIEWAKDGVSDETFIVQVRSQTARTDCDATVLKEHRFNKKGPVLAQGSNVGVGVASGTVCMIGGPDEFEHFIDGSILVAANTDPDWVPVIMRSAGVVTDHGGRTSHAAIVSRELKIPAVVGTGDGTNRMQTGQKVTVSCAESDTGFVYDGIADIEVTDIELDKMLETDTDVLLDIADPAAALRWWPLPAEGVGLAATEHVMRDHIMAHPMALAHFDMLQSEEDRRKISELTQAYSEKSNYFVEGLGRSMAKVAAAFFPKPVFVRYSDFTDNSAADLIGGSAFEPPQSNPLIGLRGPSRYCSPSYREGFELECRAIRYLRETIGFKNVGVTVPFCRTVVEADETLGIMADAGLERGSDGLQVQIMCQIPANIALVKDFAERFDRILLGYDDFAQLVTGTDMHCDALSGKFDEDNVVVKMMIAEFIREAHKADIPIGLCGLRPSADPEFVKFLSDCDIDWVTVKPESFVQVKKSIANEEVQRDIANASARR
ncbi:MAG: phosphoenolpyruvate synthase [Hyphomicrobiales bacterium]|nr:phosphoenolpyruvate synthase [Hyphomicrobiales bacterium]